MQYSCLHFTTRELTSRENNYLPEVTKFSHPLPNTYHVPVSFLGLYEALEYQI